MSRRPYPPVRSLARGVAILRELNQSGRATPSTLARAVGLDRTTTYRLLATLVDLGLVSQSPANDEFVLTEGVRGLSDGFTASDRTVRIAALELGTLFQNVLWPTDFATFVRGAMVIQETTHRFSPYSVHRAMVGKPRSLFSSSLGRAALAGASAATRSTMVEIALMLGAHEFGPSGTVGTVVEDACEQFAARGYASSLGDGATGAIALPVRSGGDVVGAINLVFFRSVMSVETAAFRHLDHMRQSVDAIEKRLAEPS